MVDVRKDIMSIENKIATGTVSVDELRQWEKLRERENELWEEYGQQYINDEFYRRYFPDDGYAEKCWQEAQERMH